MKALHLVETKLRFPTLFPEQFLTEFHSTIDRLGRISLIGRSALADMIQGKGFHILYKEFRTFVKIPSIFGFRQKSLNFRKDLSYRGFTPIDKNWH